MGATWSSGATIPPIRIITHSKFVIDRAIPKGWVPGARYTNLRDVRHLPHVYFVDIDWKRYDFDRHLHTVKQVRPQLTVARDITSADMLDDVIKEAGQLAEHTGRVVLVPKDERLASETRLGVPQMFRLGYSVPTRYGGTTICPSKFVGDVHLLGGRPDVQRRLADRMQVASLDGNRFTLDAQFGDYFDGTSFKRHPVGGYVTCLDESLKHIAALWEDYDGGSRPD